MEQVLLGMMVAAVLSQGPEEWRNVGNHYYKKGDLTLAINAYRHGAMLSNFEHPTLMSNLSAALYETGKYFSSLGCCCSIMSKLMDQPEHQALIFKVLTRMWKAFLHTRVREIPSTVEADMVLVEALLRSSPEAKAIVAAMKAEGKLQILIPDEKLPRLRERLINEIPRYRPALNTSEPFGMGHDEATNLYDSDLAKESDNGVSIFFGGIGDARNLFATIIGISKAETLNPTAKTFHLTINDVKGCVIAKSLLFFVLLDRILKTTETGKKLNKNNAKHLTLFFFLYFAQMMPEHTYTYLQSLICELRDALVQDKIKELLPSWVLYSISDPTPVIESLRTWAGDVPDRYEIPDIISSDNRDISDLLNDKATTVPKGCSSEYTLHFITQMLLPPLQLIRQHEPSFAKLLEDYRKVYDKPREKKIKNCAQKIMKHLVSNWKPNVTRVDMEWEGTRPEFQGHSFHEENPWLFVRDICSFASIKGNQFPSELGGKHNQLFNYVMPFFLEVAVSLKKLCTRVTIEVTLGDVSLIMEQIRHGTAMGRQPSFILCPTTPLGDAGFRDEDQDIPTKKPAPGEPYVRNPKGQGSPSGGATLSTLPQLYDRIHLSNIPDYIGGALASFMFAIPILKSHSAAFYTSNCMRNAFVFPNLEIYGNEYMIIHNQDQLSQLFRITFPPNQHWITEPLPLADYHRWQRSVDTSAKVEFEDLMPQNQLAEWFFSLFFKIVIPAHQAEGRRFQSRVFSPLNVTMLFRVLTELEEVGYPRHWLGSLLAKILDNAVVTKVRPPKTSPLEISEVQGWQDNPPLKVTTSPYLAELSTHTAMWRRLLPFAIMPANTAIIPCVDTIYEYTVKIQDFVDTTDFVPNIALVFYNRLQMDKIQAPVPRDMLSMSMLNPFFMFPSFSHLQELFKVNIHPLFYGCEPGSDIWKYDEVLKLREEGLHIVSTCVWDRAKLQIKFWMKKELIDGMIRDWKKKAEDGGKRWYVGIWRTDCWTSVSDPGPVVKLVKRGEKWLHF